METYEVSVPISEAIENDPASRNVLVKACVHTIERGFAAEASRNYTFEGKRVGKHFIVVATPRSS